MDQVLKLKTLLAQDKELRSRMSQEKAQPADVDISKVNAKISCEKKVTSQVALQPPDEGDSKMPAKRSPRSLEKAQPVEEGDSKVSTKKSRKSQEKALQILSIKVGHHLSLYWPNDGKWYKATVTSKDSADSNRVTLLYTDGEVEIDVDLFDEQFEIVTGCNSTKTQSKNSPESDLGSESLKSKTVEVCFIGLNVN